MDPVTPIATANPQVQPPVPTQVIYANFGRRLLAWILDYAIVFIIGTFEGVIVNLISRAYSGNYKVGGWQMVDLIGQTVIWIVYLIFFIGKFGQTPGKMILKVKVVKIGTNSAPGYLKAFIREIVGKLLSGIVLLLGYFWMLWDPQKQTWHDKIAGTAVIRV